MEIRLVPFEIENTSHVEFMLEVRSHPKVSKRLFGKPPASYEDHLEWLLSQQKIRRIFIISNHNGRLMGYCHVYNIKPESIEVGWALHPDYQKIGYGKKSVELLLKQCHRDYHGADIDLFVKTNNIRAIIIYLKFGFVPISINDGVFHMKKKFKEAQSNQEEL